MRPGINDVETKAKAGTLILANRADLPNLLREIAGYIWDSKSKLEDKPVKVDDHACDALRYACYTPKSAIEQWFEQEDELDEVQSL